VKWGPGISGENRGEKRRGGEKEEKTGRGEMTGQCRVIKRTDKRTLQDEVRVREEKGYLAR
jgi:hypothetical protein